tara:strand:- start:184 stop:483 length:300 start_codon:yes stop_codon:yes gene_type:complete
MSEDTEMPPEEDQVVANNLGIADLNMMANVIEVISKRGAFNANELADVGVLYNKLYAFLVANGVREAPDAVQHTHEDGTTHSHSDGDVEHSHNQGETDD